MCACRLETGDWSRCAAGSVLSCSNGSPNCHQTRLAVWHRAGLPVFQASGAQRGTSKGTGPGRLKRLSRGDYQVDSDNEAMKQNRCLEQRNATPQIHSLEYEPQRKVAACTACPGSAMKQAAHISFQYPASSSPTAWHAQER